MELLKILNLALVGCPCKSFDLGHFVYVSRGVVYKHITKKKKKIFKICKIKKFFLPASDVSTKIRMKEILKLE